MLSFGFLHRYPLHILENGAALLWLGNVCERRIGPGRVVNLFLVASVCSGLAILLKDQLAPSMGTSVGASGGMFGLLGASLVLVQRIPSPYRAVRLSLWVVLAIGLAISFTPNSSLTGHITGLLIGIPFGIFVRTRIDA